MAQNIDEKKTALEDDALLYKRDDGRDERQGIKQRWSSLSGAEKKQYFKDYYMKPLLIALVIIVVLIIALVDSIKNNYTTKFDVTCLNSLYLDETKMGEHAKILHDQWNLEKREQVIFSDNITVNDSAGLQAFVTYIYTGTVNAVIGTEDEIHNYGLYFWDLQNELPEDIVKAIPEDGWVYMKWKTADPNTESGEKEGEGIRGIKLKYTIFNDCINSEVVDPDTLVLAIPNTGNLQGEGIDYTLDYLRYALGINQ